MPKLTHKSSTQNDRLRNGKLYPAVTLGEGYAFQREAERRASERKHRCWPAPIVKLKVTTLEVR